MKPRPPGERKKGMKKLISLCGVFVMLMCCIFISDTSKAQELPKEEINKEPIEIIETIPIQPDVISLLEEEIHETQNWDTDCEDNTKQISYEEAQMLMKIAYSEAGNQGVEGQLKIMETVWNRAVSDDFPETNTIEEVLRQPGQFESFTNGKYDAAEPNVDSHLALAEFEKNLNHDDNPVGFETVNNGNVLLRHFDFYKIVGDHVFYKVKKK